MCICGFQAFLPFTKLWWLVSAQAQRDDSESGMSSFRGHLCGCEYDIGSEFVSAYITILLKSFLLSVQNVYANKWILKGFVHSNMIRSQVVPNLYAFFCLTHEKDFFWGIELVALFHAIALNVNRGFEASKRMQNYHKKHHKSIIRVVYDTTVQKLGSARIVFLDINECFYLVSIDQIEENYSKYIL